MATPFSEIAKLMLNEMDKSDFLELKTDIALDYMSDLIIVGATTDFAKCNKDLENITPYLEFENKITLDKDIKELFWDVNKFKINPKINNVFLTINGELIEEENYTLSKVSVSQEDYLERLDDEWEEYEDREGFLIKYDFKKDDKVEVKFYFEGEFEEDLNYNEKYIISLGAYNHYINNYVGERRLLRQDVGDRNYKLSSNWQTLKSLIDYKKSVDDKLRSYIYDYVYNNTLTETLM